MPSLGGRVPQVIDSEDNQVDVRYVSMPSLGGRVPQVVWAGMTFLRDH